MADDGRRMCLRCIKGRHAGCLGKRQCNCPRCHPTVTEAKVSTRMVYSYCTNCGWKLVRATDPLPASCPKCGVKPLAA